MADGRLEKAEGVKDWSVTIPQSVREVVGRRLDHLSDECNKVLTIGAVIGREFGIKLLEKVAEVKGDRLLEALEEAMAARVIAELPRATDQYWFSHALIRETLYEELSTTRRVRLHRQIGEALEELDAEGNLPQLAYHFAEAAPGGDVEKAVEYARKAGEKAVALYAWEDAVLQFERAVQALDLQPTVDEALKCDLLMETGQAQHGSGDQAGGQATSLKAIDAARRLQDSQRLAQAALGYALPYSVGNVDETVVSVLQEALAAMPEEDSALRARLTGRLGREMYFGSLDDNARLTSEGIEMARRVGDKQALAEALWDHLWGSTDMLEGAEQRLPLAKEMILLAEEANDRQMAITGRWSVIATTIILGDMAAANELIDDLDRVTEESRMPVFAWQLMLLRGMQAMFSGTVAEAEERAQAALAMGQRATPDIAMQMFGAQIYAIRREQGRLAEMEAGIKGFAQMYPAVPSWRTALGFGYAELGRIEEAAR